MLFRSRLWPFIGLSTYIVWQHGASKPVSHMSRTMTRRSGSAAFLKRFSKRFFSRLVVLLAISASATPSSSRLVAVGAPVVAGLVGATVLGTLVGIGRVSSNALARGLCYVYTELLRNVPILLQLLMWYVLLVEWMPDAEAPLQAWDSVFLSKGGLALPWLAWDEGAWTSRVLWELPALVEGEVRGGLIISPEFLAVTLGLTLYTSAFVAEIDLADDAEVFRARRDRPDLDRGHAAFACDRAGGGGPAPPPASEATMRSPRIG